MSSLINIILAETDEERAAARDVLAKENAAAPTDWQVLASFLKNCTTLDGKPLALDEHGCIVERND